MAYILAGLDQVTDRLQQSVFIA